MGNQILIVEDEDRISEPLARALSNRGYETSVAPTGASALKTAASKDLFLVDLNLPDIDGIDLCRRLRSVTDAPIIVLSARSGVGDKVACLEIGADDYVTKPFELDELLARIRVQIRRSDHTAEIDVEAADEIEVGRVRIDPRSRRAWSAGNELDLSPKEFDLLLLLMRNAGEVVRRETAISRVWDENWYGSTKTLDVHIGWLRKKIETNPSSPIYITTVRRVGFRFASSDELPNR
ncbi:MAG: DNA-binding response regulator [Acidobacteria bacterium]|nr:MAG: DNA-binding response regulator [Acidobacteriota bacterium]